MPEHASYTIVFGCRSLHHVCIKLTQLSMLMVYGTVALSSLAQPALAYEEDHFSPAGIWNTSLQIKSNSYSNSPSSQSKNDLLVLLIPKKEQRTNITGSIKRSFTTTRLGLQYGLTDQWNTLLLLDHIVAKQTSNLVANTADTTIKRSVDQLKNQRYSAVGDIQLQVLHRFIFNRSHSATWHAGYLHAAHKPKRYDGRHTLNAGSISSYLMAGIGYAYYPSSYPGRIFLKADGGFALPTDQKTSSKTESVKEGNRFNASVLWEREIQLFHWELGGNIHHTSSSAIGSQAQSDKKLITRFIIGIGIGSFALLEKGPQRFPFRFLFRAQPAVSATEHPLDSPFSFNFTFFF